MMIIRDWKLAGKVLCGYVYGSDRYENGTYIHTSTIVTAAEDDGIFLIRTENSVYECHAEDYAGSNEALQIFRDWCVEQDRQSTRRITNPEKF